jgi:predicted aldo/keto reductase-like oxidoreductase
MRYKLLGRTGLRVSELCLGAMTFGDESSEGRGASKEESRRNFDAFVEVGGNFIDTAGQQLQSALSPHAGGLSGSLTAKRYSDPSEWRNRRSRG